MFKNFLRLMVVFAVCPLTLYGQTKNPPSWFWGCWVVSKSLPTPGVLGLSPKQERAILGTRLVYQSDHARSGHKVAEHAKYSVKVLSGEEFLSLGHVRLYQIGIHANEVTEIELDEPDFSDLEFPGNDVFLRKDDIVIAVENDYFVATRASAQDPGCHVSKTQAP